MGCVIAEVGRGCEPAGVASAFNQRMHVPADIRRLYWVADKGEAPETPFILIAELLLVLIPIAIVLLAIGLGLYYAYGGP